ncbi:transposase [Acidiferrobacter sp. SPIII_3]|uniref:transposase n=1 Tax=Acidiferrobacter sp. SPIII_3 TaxID=1281578 RepID=UPI0011AB82B7
MDSNVSPPSGPSIVCLVSFIRCVPHRLKYAANVSRDKKPFLACLPERHVSLGAVEGLNNKLKASIRTSYGFRTPKAIKIMLYHKLGALPEPELTHRFC